MFLRWLLTRAKLWTQSHQGLIQLRLFGDGWGPEGELVNRVHTHTFLGDDVIAPSFNPLPVFLSALDKSCVHAGKLVNL